MIVQKGTNPYKHFHNLVRTVIEELYFDSEAIYGSHVAVVICEKEGEGGTLSFEIFDDKLPTQCLT